MLRKIITVLLFVVATNVFASPLYTIGVKEAKPFSYKENGQWKGISINLIRLLSEDMGFRYKFVEDKTVDQLIGDTENHATDFSIAAVSTTAAREKVVDFSHPYFSTSMGILSYGKPPWYETVWWIAKRLLITLVIFIVGLYIVGALADKIDGDENIRNPHEGAWWALVTFTTTGYGDYVPKTGKGKIFASIWMVASLILLSTFTGYLASAMTIKQMSTAPITLGNLYSSSVVTVKGTTSQRLLDNLGIKYHSVQTADEAVDLVMKRRVRAFAYDSALLQYYANTNGNLSMVTVDANNENYAIVFPQGSQLTEQFNVGILRVMTSPKWKDVRHEYFVQ